VSGAGTPERLAGAVRDESARELPREEAERWVNAPWAEGEREEVLSLVAWFCRRYPTPLERLAYVRRAYARWRHACGRSGEAVKPSG